MIKIKLALADNDDQYINRLINHFTANYSDKLEIYSFTDVEPLIEFIKKNPVDVMIATEAFGVNTKEIPAKIAFAYFSDSSDIDMIGGQKTICKYQKADLIYKEILSLYSENSDNDIIFKTGKLEGSKIITFLSSSGGVGSSTIAAAYAINLARKGKKVLYLNLEQFGSSKAFFTGKGNFNFSDVLFAIKSKKSNLSMKLESTVKHDETGVYFYDECKTPLDISEMTEEDLKKLIDELQIAGLYQYVIITINSTLSKQTTKVLNESGLIILISDGSEISNDKVIKLYQTFELLENQYGFNLLSKTSLIYNKFSSTDGKHISGIDIKVVGGVQRFKGATAKQIAEQISNNFMFDKLQ